MEQLQVCVGSNKCLHCISTRKGIVAFGAGHAVAIWEPSDELPQSIRYTINEHTDRVNTVKWMNGTQDLLLSGSEDGFVNVYRFAARRVAALQKIAVGQPVLTLDALEGPTGDMIVSLVTVQGEWRNYTCPKGDDKFELVHSEVFAGSALALSVAVSTLRGSWLFALGTVGGKIYVFLQSGWKGDTMSVKQACLFKGNFDWVRSLKFSIAATPAADSDPVDATASESGIDHPALGTVPFFPTNSIMLASSSQDNRVWLWRIEDCEESKEVPEGAGVVKTYRLGENIYNVHFDGRLFKFVVDGVLIGHEQWVMDIAWLPPVSFQGLIRQPQAIMSCSMDRTVIVWAPNNTSNIWFPMSTIGALGGVSGLFSQLGYYGCVWNSSTDIIANGFVAELHRWTARGKLWESNFVPTGHGKEISDIALHPSGHYIATVSADQTARLWAFLNGRLVEIARPQIHGHDIHCAAFVNNGNVNLHTLATGADEKILRLFDSPYLFFQSFANVMGEAVGDPSDPALAYGSVVPVLGLSNIPIKLGDNIKSIVQHNEVHNGELESIAIPTLVPLKTIPLEENLLQDTLWPERIKLYGHMNEIISLAAMNHGPHIASASKSQSLTQSQIIIWDAAGNTKLHSLAGHQLTVTQLRYNAADTRLLSVSRDRNIMAWHASQDYELLYTIAGSHTRIIWDCSYFTVGDDEMFATCGRDKVVNFWREATADGALTAQRVHTLTCEDSCTAIAAIGSPTEATIAVGFEEGSLSLFRLTAGGPELLHRAPTAHTRAVRRVAFAAGRLLSVSDDASLRVFALDGAGA